MPSSDGAAAAAFVPLAGDPPADAATFRPFGGAGEAPAPDTEPAGGAEDEARAVRGAFQAGREQGRHELEGEVAAMRDGFVRALEELVAFRARLRDGYERELLQVALGVARKVVQQELAERPEIWLGMIRAAVRRAVERERVVVRVAEPLATFLRERTPALRALVEDVEDLEVVADASLPPGGCVVQGRLAEVDIGVDTQLEAVGAALLSAER
jgi:flagellar assembly protein FliH